MKLIVPILCLTFLISCIQAPKEIEEFTNLEIIELPLNRQAGYGPFIVPFSYFMWRQHSPESSWGKTLVETKGIPENYKRVVVKQIWFDAHQFVYQNYKQGNLTEKRYSSLTESWNIDTISHSYSASPIKCFSHIVMYYNTKDTIYYKLDQNNNLDFSDDEEHIAYRMMDWKKRDSLAEHPIILEYEDYKNGKVVNEKFPILVVQNSDGTNLMYNFPSYSETQFKGETLQITADFDGPTYGSECSIHIKDSSEAETPDLIGKNEYLKFDNQIFKNLGVNQDAHTLMLQKMPKDTVLYSSQVGFMASPFREELFLTDDSVSLDSYVGKYLYLEFWGSWCAPCVQEIPNLKAAYDSLDHAKIEFLGIANNDSLPLHRIIKKKGINWPQVMWPNDNGIIDTYNITSYPTSLLIDPNGIIVAKNLRGEGLMDTLSYYIQEP